VTEGIKNQKVVDFDISENVIVIKLENGEVWWSGMKLVFRPEKLPIDITTKPGVIGACRNGLAIVTGDKVKYYVIKVQIKNDFAKTKTEDVKTGIHSTTIKELFGVEGEVVELGGAYNNKYAVIH
jgi:hypothetical protein